MKIRDLFIEVRLRGEKALKDLKAIRKAAEDVGTAMGKAAMAAMGFGKETASAGGKAARSMDDVADRTKSASSTLSNLGNIASTTFRAFSGALVDAVKEAVAFESSMANIAKVVPGLKTKTGETTAEFDKMKDSIFELSSKIAIAPKGFAEIIAAAGQAGIAREELGRFAEDAAKMAVAFDTSADKAGEAMAKMRTGMGLSQDEVWQLAGVFNHLGQNMAVHANELVDVTRRVGAMAQSAGLAKEQTAALAATMIASGAKTNVAATGIKNFTLSLAAGEAATHRQRVAYERLGLDSVEVAKNFAKGGESTKATIMDVLQRIKGLDEAERAATLMQLFGKESIGAIAPMLTQLDKLGSAFDLAADKEKTLVSVQNEYNVRAKTTENSWEVLKNKATILSIRIGDSLLPAINDLLNIGNSPEAGKFIDLFVGGIQETFQKTIELGKELGDKLRPVFEAIFSVASGLFSGLMGGVEKAYTAMQPFIQAIGDLGAKVVEALGLGSEEGEKFGESMGSAFGDTMVAIIDTFTNVVKGLVDVIGFLMPVLQPVATFLKGALVAAIDRITGMIGYLRDQFGALGDAFRAFTSGNFAEGFAKLGKMILNALVEPLRITARMLVDLADALPGGSNMVPSALRTFAGRSAVAGVAGMIEKVRGKAAKEGAASDNAAAEEPMMASRQSMQGGNITAAQRKQMFETPAEKLAEKNAELAAIAEANAMDGEMGSAGGSSGGGKKKGRKRQKIDVVTDLDVISTLQESPAETRMRIKDEAKARKELKRERKNANVLDRAVMDAAGRASGMSADRGGGVGPSVTNIYNTFAFQIDARGNEGAAANVERAGRAAGSAFASNALRGVGRASMAARSGGGTAAGAG